MDDPSAIVELVELRETRTEEIRCLKNFLTLQDVGIDEDVAHTCIAVFNVFSGSYYGTVPVLRLSTSNEDREGLCLSQVIVSPDQPAVMGKTAVVSPISDLRLENEKQIVLSAFLTAKAELIK